MSGRDTPSGGRVRTEVRDHVFQVVLDRPHRRNALSPELWQGLEDALDELEGFEGVTAMTLAGAGGTFCVGGDLKALQSGTSHFTTDANSSMQLLEHEQEVVRRLVAAPVLTIALVDGAATGGGFDLALACDVRASTPDAKLGAVFVRLGLVPDLGGLWLLQRLVGHSMAATLTLTGRIIDGVRAHETGIVQALATDGDLVAAVAPWIEAAGHAKPYAVRRVKSMLVRAQLEQGRGLAAETAALQSILLGTPEFEESLAAFGLRSGSR